MRTTLNLPDDIYEIARSVAHARGVSLGEAVAQLARQGLKPAALSRKKKAFPCFAVSPDARPITLEQTLEAEDEP
ncbi:MAG: CopG family transcriptional regulator [Acidobacteriia bacterium]|nr:CopG family transcriptional regulator [Terriglobia bacterium]